MLMGMRWLSSVTIEPMMILTGLAFNMGMVAQEQMLLYKICREEKFGRSEEYCRAFEEQVNKTEICIDGSENNCYTDIEHEVVNFNYVVTMSEHVIPILLSFYLGSWSDKYGRKPFIAVCLIGKVVSATFSLMNGIFLDSWNRWVWLASVMIPSNITGGYLTWIMVTYSFIADNSSTEARTIRLGIITICFQISRPVATAFGAFLFHSGSYVCVFGTALLLTVLGGVAGLIPLWSFQETQTTDGPSGGFCDNFHPKHVMDSFKSTFKHRKHNKRSYLLIMMAVMLLSILPMFGEFNFQFMYTKRLFGWGVEDYSWYNTLATILGSVGLVLFLPIFHFLNVNDNFVIVLSIISGIGGPLMRGLATTESEFYASVAIEMLFTLHSPPIRAQMTKCVERSENGKVFAMLASIESIVPIIASTLYSQLYNAATAEGSSLPSGVCYFVSCGFLLIALLLSLIVLESLMCKSIPNDEENDIRKLQRSHSTKHPEDKLSDGDIFMIGWTQHQ